jgi:hypothetical protein
LVALTSLVVFSTNLATTENNEKNLKNEDITWNLKLFTQAIFKVMIFFG